MAHTATLTREEKVGLGIAVAAHAALALLFVVQGDTGPQLPVPERMEVSLASDVSLESTAPDPSADPKAAFAPELADEVAEAPPEVEQMEIEQPVEQAVAPPPPPRPRAEPRPTPTPTQAPQTRRSRPDRQATPAPQPTRTATASRLSEDFLEGTSTNEGSEAGSAARNFGPAEQAALSDAITRQLRPHWQPPSGVDADKLVTFLTWEMNRDGSLKGRPTLVRQAGVNPSNRPQADLHAERAIRAVQAAAPFRLPEEFYDRWKRVREWRFDVRL